MLLQKIFPHCVVLAAVATFSALKASMALPVMEFQDQGYKSRKILPKNQHTQRKLLNFENWNSEGLRSFQKSEFYKSIIFILTN